MAGRLNGRSRRIAGALGTIGAVALAIGMVVGAGLPGSSQGAGTPARSSGATTVQRRDLVATDTESGTLSYAGSETVFNRISGTITSLPAVGQVIKPGQALYQVDGSPVILFNGTTPAYRDLTSGVSNGQDVLELNQNLVSLGFDTTHQIVVNDTWQAATTTAVETWQASLGETQTGTVTLGQIVFLPGQQRITAVDSVLGSTGGAAGSGAAAGTSGSTSTGASITPVAPKPEFVSLTTSAAPPAAGTWVTPGALTTAVAPDAATTAKSTAARSCPSTLKPPAGTAPKPRTGTTSPPVSTCKAPSTSAQTLAALIALLKAETLELKKSKTPSSGTASAGASRSAASSGAASTSARSGAASSSAGGSGAATGASSGSGSGSASGGSTAQAILGTTSTRLVVTVSLDATKQSEAVVGEPVTVQLPNGNTVDGKITQVSPVAQTASSSSSGSSSGGAAGGGASSSTPSATVPITIALNGRHPDVGLDQAAVSVNFQQQVANNVLSVPVTALLATAGGGYAVQEEAAPHQLIPVSTGLFAAGYVQISGSQIFSGLQVTDSQG